MGKYYIGMDAGGTGTTVLVSDGRKDLFLTKTEGLNCNSFPLEHIAKSLREAADSLLENGYIPADCAGIGIGAAGNNNPAASAARSPSAAMRTRRCTGPSGRRTASC